MNLKNALRIAMMEMAAAISMRDNGHGVFGQEPRAEMRFNPDYRRPKESRELREFNVKGKKVMAYSRKDAIKRLKHNEGRK